MANQEIIYGVIFLAFIISAIFGYIFYIKKKNNGKMHDKLKNLHEQEVKARNDFSEAQTIAFQVEKEEEEGSVIESDISSKDLLEEAKIYIEYEHYLQAATVLRWYVDIHPKDVLAVNLLLDVYLKIPDLDSFTNLLASFGETVGVDINSIDYKNRVIQGLRNDPTNLELMALAERLNIPTDSIQNQTETMTAAKAQAIVSRNQNNPAYCTSVIWAAIQNEPMHLSLYAELMRIYYNERDRFGFMNALIAMDIAVGKLRMASSIRERMVRAGRNLGDDPLWDKILENNGARPLLLQLAKERQIEIPESLEK